MVVDSGEHGLAEDQKHITYLSFGAGPPSVALLILNVRGVIQPKAEIVMFADPGSEDPRTYEALASYRKYSELHAVPFQCVSANLGKLYDHIVERSVPIPAYTSKGIARRQCTERWKIRPIHRYLRQDLGYRKLTAQLGMTHEEVWRMRESPSKYVTNIYPLIDLRITRDACVELIRDEGLPVPPRSACIFCPLKSTERWKATLHETPGSFELATTLEAHINRRQAMMGRDSLYLSYKRRPLAVLREQWLGEGAIPGESDDLGYCDSGYCFT